MRKLLLTYFLGLGLLVGYLASPLVTAWFIREAIHNGQSDYHARKIEWPAVKESLKASMMRVSLGPAAASGFTEPDPDMPNEQPGLWKRIKAAYGRYVVTGMVDTMLTPEGLPKLLEYRRTYDEKVRHIPDPRTLPLKERLASVWERVVRAEFVSPTRFAFEMRDHADPSRSYAGILAFEQLEWRLVSLEVRGERKPGLVARAWSAVRQAALP
ncbi:MAG: DUF2939 domain-containing protein [Hyphomicrobiaceae bacterium]